jgi:hypothetical protein
VIIWHGWETVWKCWSKNDCKSEDWSLLGKPAVSNETQFLKFREITVASIRFLETLVTASIWHTVAYQTTLTYSNTSMRTFNLAVYVGADWIKMNYNNIRIIK